MSKSYAKVSSIENPSKSLGKIDGRIPATGRLSCKCYIRLAILYARRSPAADLQLLDLPGKRIAVNPQNLSGPTQVAVGFIEHPGDEPLVELRSSVLEIDAPVDHFDDQLVEQITHVRRPARGR